jgi:hypothetical protein
MWTFVGAMLNALTRLAVNDVNPPGSVYMMSWLPYISLHLLQSTYSMLFHMPRSKLWQNSFYVLG